MSGPPSWHQTRRERGWRRDYHPPGIEFKGNGGGGGDAPPADIEFEVNKGWGPRRVGPPSWCRNQGEWGSRRVNPTSWCQIWGQKRWTRVGPPWNRGEQRWGRVDPLQASKSRWMRALMGVAVATISLQWRPRLKRPTRSLVKARLTLSLVKRSERESRCRWWRCW